MRFLAVTIALLAGPALSMGIGEFEKQIAAEPTLEGKIALAKKGFDTIEGFVPRELFMSYWSIDALSEIAASYKEILDSEGIEGLVPEYSNLSRICTMEMGDYRYFFEPLKADIEAHLNEAAQSERKNGIVHEVEDWSEESIKSLIEFWLVSGQAEWRNNLKKLLNEEWSESEIEYWTLLVSYFRLSPSELLDAIEIEILERQNLLVIATFLKTASDDDDAFWSAPTLSANQSEVSTGGPRLD